MLEINPSPDPQETSAFAQLPTELHELITMECESDETVLALMRTCKKFSLVYHDFLYKRNVALENGNAIFKIARHGSVAALEHLYRTAGTQLENQPRLDRVEFRSSMGQSFIGTSLADRIWCTFTPEYAFTPLHWAAARGHADAVQWLLTRGADCNALGVTVDDKLTPQRTFRTDIGVPLSSLPDQAEDNHGTPLYMAVCAGHLEASRRLLAVVPYTQAFPARASSPSVLHIAALYGHTDLIRLLLGTGRMSPYAGDGVPHQTLAIEYAVMSRMGTPSPSPSLRCFVEMGYDISRAVGRCVTEGLWSDALACLRDSSTGFDLGEMVSYSPPMNHATYLLITCLDTCSVLETRSDTNGDFMQLVRHLIRSGGDVNPGPIVPLLHQAMRIHWNDDSLVRLLVENGARVNPVWREEAPLRIYLDNVPIEDFNMRPDGSSVAKSKIELLLSHGADPNQHSDDDWSLSLLEMGFRIAMMHYSFGISQESFLSPLQLLVEYGAGYNAVDVRNQTQTGHDCLSRALYLRRYDVARILIRRPGGDFTFAKRHLSHFMDDSMNMPQDIKDWLATI